MKIYFLFASTLLLTACSSTPTYAQGKTLEQIRQECRHEYKDISNELQRGGKIKTCINSRTQKK